MNTAQKILKGLTHDYHVDPNPLYCWEAWRISRESGEPLPEFAADYFDRVAAKVVTMDDPAPQRLHSEIAEATEFKTPGRGTPFSRAQDYGVWEGSNAPDKVRLFAEAQAEVALGTPIPEAFREVAERLPVTETKVRDAYYSLRERFTKAGK